MSEKEEEEESTDKYFFVGYMVITNNVTCVGSTCYKGMYYNENKIKEIIYNNINEDRFNSYDINIISYSELTKLCFEALRKK